MTDKVLVLVDGSIFAESVCFHAAWLAQRLRAPVEAMHVIGRREAIGGPEPSGPPQAEVRDAILDALAGLDAEMAKLAPNRARTTLDVDTDLSAAARAATRAAILGALAGLDEQRAKLSLARGQVILEDARTILAANGAEPVSIVLRRGDLVKAVTEPGLRSIVMGKRGEDSAFATEFVGSNLERVARAVSVPMLIAAETFRPITRVMMAWDATPSAERAVARIAVSPIFRGLDITLVHVGERTGLMAVKMEASAARLRMAGLVVDTDFVTGAPEDALQSTLEKGGYDLLVMGAYGHSRLRHLVIGSTTSMMLRICKPAIILYR